ncbi:enterobacteria phage lambda, capsid assembly protein [Escherichia coli]|uniref:Enterobacteria phage lambda, capsid assembly protein n=1 Tax=Escherichia coli TaxID=562 RepID=A0A2X3KGX7_ECOLX|nr:enterobacteria phage lambda, capsid assembly protein [Escherichia coli]
MTVKTARRILAAAPQSAQARSDTALDRLMQGAPAPLAAGNPASDAVNDFAEHTSVRDVYDEQRNLYPLPAAGQQ